MFADPELQSEKIKATPASNYNSSALDKYFREGNRSKNKLKTPPPLAVRTTEQRNRSTSKTVLKGNHTDMYVHVPTKVSRCPIEFAKFALTPKSDIFTSPWWLTSKFDGLISRWMIRRLWCRKINPWRTCPRISEETHQLLVERGVTTTILPQKLPKQIS